MQKQYTCCELGLCGKRSNFPDRIQPDANPYQYPEAIDTSAVENNPPLTRPTSNFVQFSQYALEALYRFQISMQTAQDAERLAYELALAETEQN